MRRTIPKILIVEDDNEKFSDISKIVRNAAPAPLDMIRAETAREAERLCLLIRPDLLVLDISMNISPGGLGPMKGGFANLGGMDILEALYYSDALLPTIIVTGFDLFKAQDRKSEYEIIGLSEIEEAAQTRLGKLFYGCIRYQGKGWESALTDAVARWGRS